jgi:dTDP-4-dehydrorhamnose reductase
MPKIMLIGKRGQVGWELNRSLSILGDLFAFDRTGLDLTNSAEIRKVVREVRPDVIVNAAAYTAVDRAETESSLAMAINGEAPGILAEEAQKLGALLVHYSTDYVFDGQGRVPYLEDQATAPVNYYGTTKLAGECAIQQLCDRYLILRTSWVYGTYGINFLRTMIRLGEEREMLRIVDDQVGAPTWTRHIADGTSQIIAKTLASDVGDQLSGVFHLTAGGEVSWFGFASAIFDCLKRKGVARQPQLVRIPTSEYPLPATRPAYSVLSNAKIMKNFDIEIPDWKEGLEYCLAY